MSEEILINKNATITDIYDQVIANVQVLLNPDEPVISNLSNLTALLKQSFDKISWVGFYLLSDNKLFLGPFQGKTACTVIDIGKGVCGTAAESKETVIVEDVDKFPGHIACDSGSKSEIVVPLVFENVVYGVLDLDSHEYSAFSQTDKLYLEKIVSLLYNFVDFKSFKVS